MRTTTDTATDQQYRRELALNVFRLLRSNAYNVRPIFKKGKNIVDAVRANIWGTTLTVEVTTARHGEQNDPDALRYACYEISSFRTWFADLLQSNGLAMQPPATTHPREFAMFMGSNQRPVIANRIVPMCHRKTKRKQ